MHTFFLLVNAADVRAISMQDVQEFTTPGRQVGFKIMDVVFGGEVSKFHLMLIMHIYNVTPYQSSHDRSISM